MTSELRAPTVIVIGEILSLNPPNVAVNDPAAVIFVAVNANVVVVPPMAVAFVNKLADVHTAFASAI